MNRAARRNHLGFSLIELMIALTIGLLLLAGLTTIFVSSSDSSRELQKAAQQIENGRYAIDLLTQDLRLAGFYDHLHDIGSIAMPGTIPPDPCESANLAELQKALNFPVQGYRGTIDATTPASDAAPDISATSCGGLLTTANLKKGSDILVVRRADTNALAAADTPDLDVLYIQATAIAADIQKGRSSSSSTIGTTKNATGAVSVLYLGNPPITPPAAPIRKLHVNVYFVAPCSVGSGTGGVCTGAAAEDRIPTLKRLELTTSGTMTLVPLVEGIDYFKVEYGVDTTPTAINTATGYIGDGAVDSFSEAPADWKTVIAAKVYLLVRNTELTTGFTDDKTYQVGSAAASDNVTVPAATGANARFKRHVFSAAVELVNPAGRREIP